MESIIGLFAPKPSVYDQYQDTSHVSDAAFHGFYEYNPNASAVIQGFVTMTHRMLTGEPAIPYSMMHLVTDAQKLKMFLFAFGVAPEEMPATVEELWERSIALFGESKFTPAPPNKSLAVENPTGKA